MLVLEETAEMLHGAQNAEVCRYDGNYIYRLNRNGQFCCLSCLMLTSYFIVVFNSYIWMVLVSYFDSLFVFRLYKQVVEFCLCISHGVRRLVEVFRYSYD